MIAKSTSKHLPFKHAEVTEKILAGFYTVYNTLGYGFLEKVYEKAILVELAQLGLTVDHQCPIQVYYKDHLIGEYVADVLVENKILVEIKATSTLLNEHEAQLLNYLKATPYEVGLLLNFGPVPQYKRKAFENTRKEWWVHQNQK